MMTRFNGWTKDDFERKFKEYEQVLEKVGLKPNWKSYYIIAGIFGIISLTFLILVGIIDEVGLIGSLIGAGLTVISLIYGATKNSMYRGTFLILLNLDNASELIKEGFDRQVEVLGKILKTLKRIEEKS